MKCVDYPGTLLTSHVASFESRGAYFSSSGESSLRSTLCSLPPMAVHPPERATKCRHAFTLVTLFFPCFGLRSRVRWRPVLIEVRFPSLPLILRSHTTAALFVAMSSPPRLDTFNSEPSEEEEELGTLSSSPSSTMLPKPSPGSGKEGCTTPSFTRVSARGARDATAASREADDEFAMDVTYVTAKAGKELLKEGQTASALTGRPGGSSLQPRRHGSYGLPGYVVSAQKSGGAQKQSSIAARWDSGESEALNQYKGSAALDDTDRAQDEAEYTAWVRRAALRRRDLLA